MHHRRLLHNQNLDSAALAKKWVIGTLVILILSNIIALIAMCKYKKDFDGWVEQQTSYVKNPKVWFYSTFIFLVLYVVMLGCVKLIHVK